MTVTVKDLVNELLKVNGEDYDKKIISIGTYSGSDRPAEYCIHLEDNSEIMIGKRN